MQRDTSQSDTEVKNKEGDDFNIVHFKKEVLLASPAPVEEIPAQAR